MGKPEVDLLETVKSVLDEVLSLRGRGATFTRQTRLMGDIVELDSMAIAAIITSFEERLGVAVDTDEMDGDTFATVGSLADYLQRVTSVG